MCHKSYFTLQQCALVDILLFYPIVDHNFSYVIVISNASSPSYNRNSLDAIQGGALALLVEGAAESAGSKLGLCRVRDLEIHYLALGRTGPIQARPRILRRDADSALVRVEIVDGGAEDRTVVIATAELGKSAEAP